MKIFCTCTSRPEKAANPPTGDDGIPRLPLLLLLIYAMIAHEYLLNVAYLIACARVRTSVRPKHGRRKIFDEYGGVVTSCIRINRRARKTFYKKKNEKFVPFSYGEGETNRFFSNIGRRRRRPLLSLENGRHDREIDGPSRPGAAENRNDHSASLGDVQ